MGLGLLYTTCSHTFHGRPLSKIYGPARYGVWLELINPSASAQHHEHGVARLFRIGVD